MARNKIDQINDAFIAIMVKENSRQYSEYIKAINREMIENVDSLTPSKVKEILSHHKLDLENTTILFAIQSAILLILMDKQKAKKQQELLPIIAMMGLYSLKKPKRFVAKMVKISKGVGLNEREKTARKLYTEFTHTNSKILKHAQKISQERVERSIIKSKSNKRMIRDFKKFQKEGITVAKIKNKLVRKYNKLSNVERVLDTELHTQAEYVRLEHSKAIGNTHKIWRTQQDSRVRETHFHINVANKRVPIDSDFRQGGLKAQQPGDNRLPPSDRIRCRCYLVFE